MSDGELYSSSIHIYVCMYVYICMFSCMYLFTLYLYIYMCRPSVRRGNSSQSRSVLSLKEFKGERGG